MQEGWIRHQAFKSEKLLQIDFENHIITLRHMKNCLHEVILGYLWIFKFAQVVVNKSAGLTGAVSISGSKNISISHRLGSSEAPMVLVTWYWRIVVWIVSKVKIWSGTTTGFFWLPGWLAEASAVSGFRINPLTSFKDLSYSIVWPRRRDRNSVTCTRLIFCFLFQVNLIHVSTSSFLAFHRVSKFSSLMWITGWSWPSVSNFARGAIFFRSLCPWL